MLGFEPTGFADFDRLATVFRRTLELLDALVTTGDLPDGGVDVLATESLAHIEDVEQGFRAWLRTGENDRRELQHLVLQGGLGLPAPRGTAEARAALIEAMQARSGAAGERELERAPAWRLAALEHARLAFAMLPVTPSVDVRFPAGLRTYADIPAPRGPTELAERIEELERELWAAASGRRPPRLDTRYRRVYGFFDAGERLASRGLHMDDRAN